ncbi:MAG: tRNA glutamyl-Q(34) synthetase GluQRS [Propionibacteriaceae bacterium]|jgi:glutamyl-tRNA synthetase|nr:tRNA glutamyl-Q(34) synthetase GluQRS [Propionibacteriaceae bacterium]
MPSWQFDWPKAANQAGRKMAGRFAPTPTAALHLGNLRTAVGAWLAARSAQLAFRLRIEDLDQARVQAAPGLARAQIDDLARLGLDFDGPVLYQSARQAAYQRALERIEHLTYECFCSRREIAAAAQAPHQDGAAYPGWCRDLSPSQRRRLRQTRRPALRVRADQARIDFQDLVAGPRSGSVDDFVVRRGDGVFAYHFAVVVDDAAQSVSQVVRGDDLLDSTPRQIWLGRQLGLPQPVYAHLPLVLDGQGDRLAKRDRAVGLDALTAAGFSPARLVSILAASLGVAVPGPECALADLVGRFDLTGTPRQPWRADPATW